MVHCLQVQQNSPYFWVMRLLKYLAGYTIPLSVFISLYLGGIWSFAAVVYAFVVIPILEFLLPRDTANLSKAEEEIARNDRFYDVLLYLNVPLQYGMLLYFCLLLDTGTYAGWEVAGMISAMGLSCGVTGINVAHELGHRKPAFEQFMAKALLLTSLYTHFIIEHNKGHHKRVSTEEDPASARFGESLYLFWLRSVRDSWLSAWEIEKKERNRKGLPVLSLGNQMIRFTFIQALLMLVIGLVFSWAVMLCFLAAALIGILLLETINYVEHYGLSRNRTDSGNYERVMPWHSWNSDHFLGRICLYELTRHSDHHYLASRKYQVLRHMDEAPQMPAGYPAMMLLALVPPIWFRIMDPKVNEISSRSLNPASA